MRLTKVFMLTTALMLTLVTIMLARSLIVDWRTSHSAQSGLQTMELAYLAMKVAEKASAERGPTIPVLNDTVPADPAKRERLNKAREASNQAFAAAITGLELKQQSTQSSAIDNAIASLTRAQLQLKVARAEVDRIAALPYEERTASGSNIRRLPIDQMFAVIDAALDSVTQLTAAALYIYPQLSQPLEGARLGAILREYAGRLGSQFTTPLANQKPLLDSERNDIHALIGRVGQLRQLIEMQAQSNANEPRVTAALAEMKARYFAVGLPFIQSLTDAGTAGRPYGVDTGQFVTRYVAEMASIVTMRDAMFDVARSGAIAQVAEAKRNFEINAFIGGAVLLIELCVFLLLRGRVLRPLLSSTRSLVNIANGRIETALSPTRRRDEIGDLQNALTALQATNVAKQSLEREREALIGQLQSASVTDYVTGLVNRRGFVERGNELLAEASLNKRSIAVLLLDLDHFKSVNDQYGHAVGDTVLQQVANVGRSVVRETDLFARYGGEEFIVLTTPCSADDAEALATRLRAAVEKQFFGVDTARLRVTISLGVVCAEPDQRVSLESLVNQADQALYRAKAAGRNRSVQLRAA